MVFKLGDAPTLPATLYLLVTMTTNSPLAAFRFSRSFASSTGVPASISSWIFVIISIGLVFISYVAGFYFGQQWKRDVINQPLFWSQHKNLLLVLGLIFGHLLTLYSAYIGFQQVGLWYSVLLLFARYVLLPTLFNNLLFAFIKKIGF